MVTAMCFRGATRAVPVVMWGLPEQARVSGTSFNPHLSKIRKEMGKKKKTKGRNYTIYQEKGCGFPNRIRPPPRGVSPEDSGF